MAAEEQSNVKTRVEAFERTFCSSLMDQSVRYRSLSLNTTSNQLRREGAAAEHQDILNATLERKADLACELLTHHYKTTLEGLRHVIPR